MSDPGRNPQNTKAASDRPVPGRIRTRLDRAAAALCFWPLFCGCSEDRSRKPEAAALTRQGEAYLRSGKYLRAEKVLRRAVKKAPRDLDAWTALGRALKALGKLREAAQVMSDALKDTTKDHPHRYEAMILLGDVLGRQGKHNQAISVFNRARKLKPGRPEAYFQMARLYTAYKEFDVARALYQKLAERHRGKPLAAEVALQWAALEEKAGRKGAGVALLERALASAAPGKVLTARVRARAGRMLMEMKQYGKALAHLNRAAILSPGSGRVQADLGETLTALGRCSEAVVPLRKAVKMRGDDPRPAALVAACLSRSGKKAEREEAYAMALRARALDPKNDEITILLARLHLERGLAAPALDLLDQIRTTADRPPDPHYWRLRGRVLSALGDHRQALHAFGTALALDPQDRKTVRMQALTARKAGAYKRAAAALAEILKQDPADYDVMIDLAIAHEHLGRRVRARAVLRQAANLRPQRQEAWVYLGWISLRAGQLNNAVQSVQKAMTLEGGHRIHALDVMAQIRARQGKFAEGMDALKQARALARTPAEKKYIDGFIRKLSRRLSPRAGRPTP